MLLFKHNKLFVLLSFLLAANLLAQPSPRRNIFIETNIIPAENVYNCYISFRIPYNTLIFVKNGRGYHSGAELLLEIKDSNDLVYKRESGKAEIVLPDYDETNSRGEYLEGLIKTRLEEGKYRIIPELILMNTKMSGRLPPLDIEVASDELPFVHPIPIYSDSFDCGSLSGYRIANYENNFPFSPDDYDLALFVKKLDADELKVVITQNSEIVFSEVLRDPVPVNLSLDECGNAVLLTDREDFPEVNLFVAKGFGTKLREGTAEIEVTNGELSRKFSINIAWMDKPFSLMNPEFAIRLLYNVLPEREVDDLLDSPSELYYESLAEYWRKKDPIKETAFNELMEEFYVRADYAIRNFASANKINGAETDRGKIYLKFGKPEKIERIYPEKNQILEIWNYERLNKKFVFEDTEGLGNYYLVD